MSDANGSPGFTVWPQFLLALMLAAGAIFSPWPLLGTRPDQPLAGVESVGVQQVEARLWQDPFSAVARHDAKKLGDAHTMAWLSEQAGKKCGANKHCSVAALGVLLPGSPYVGAEEFRRRIRYAVISALGTAGYAPEDADHIGYVEPGMPKLLPFEWHTRKSGDEPAGTARHILLLWLDEAALGQHPREGGPAPLPARLQSLLQTLPPTCDLHLIGPASSGSLRGLLDASSAPGEKPEFSFFRRLHWHSPFATLAPARLQAGADSHDTAFAGRFGGFTSQIADDAQLARALAGELAARGICSRCPTWHGMELPGGSWPVLGRDGLTVALVGQRDTAYARGLTAALEEALRPYRVEVLKKGYLRGIDGKRAGGGDKDDKADKDAKTAIERPEGDAQIDYLRRLSQDLLHRQNELLRAGKPGIRAIGILGDDYHDKLLALEAMRGAIPDALFFTTDLDAAMLHPADNRYTRNLLVASGYGLQLAPPAQGDAPPFRDSYQTAAYATTRTVLAQLDGADADAPAWRQTRLFEVARSRFVPLNTVAGSCASFPGDCANPQAGAARERPLWRLVWVLATLASGGLLLALLYPDWRRALRQPRRRRRWLYGGAFGAALVAGFAASLPMPAGEPLGWLEGNSAWPTEFIRLGAGLLALCLLARAQATLAASARRCMTRYFKGVGPDPDSGPHRSTLMVLHDFLRALGHEPRLNPMRPHDSRSLLRRTLGKRTFVAPPFLSSARPYLLIILMFWALGVAIFMAYGFPRAPVRSFTMRALDYGVVMLSISAFLWLLVYVLRVTRHAIVMARALAGETRWPTHSLERFGMADASLECLYDDWMDVQLLARATEPVQRLVYYPFLILFLLFFAQSSLFDHWVAPLSLYLLVGFTLAVLLGSAWRLRRVAESVRSDALRRLARYRMQLLGEGEGGLVSQVDEMAHQIRTINVGVFANLSQQPLARALLSFLSGISGLSLLEYFSLSGL